MSVYDVTSGATYDTLSAAISGSVANDVLWLDAGSYVENFPDITHNLTIEQNPTLNGTGLVQLSNPQALPPNGRAVLNVPGDKNVNLSIAGLEIFGANNDVLGNANGAGILFETGNGTLTVNNCWIHNNEDGILTGGTDSADPQGMTIDITNSQINNNGAPTNSPRYGYDHNIYVGAASAFYANNNNIHDALGGHEIKSTALSNTITNNIINDGQTAATSYSIDLPNGGSDIINGNTFTKGPNSANKYFVHFGSTTTYANSSLQISANTITDERSGGAVFLLNQSVDSFGNVLPASIQNNQFTNLSAAYVSEDQKWFGGYYADVTTVDILTGNTFPTACFLAGSHILTLRGHVKVEALEIGDQVVLRRGGVAPIRWIGHRAIDCDRHPNPAEVWPIRVRAGAFGEGMPIADLLLSPDHAVHADGVLIPIRYLVNGRSICQEATRHVRYFHVELPAHDVLLAEGLPCETYLDTGNRGAFANGGPVMQLHPDLAHGVWSTKAFAPLAVGGPKVVRVRQRLLNRATELGFTTTDDAAPALSAGGRAIPTCREDGLLRATLREGTGTIHLLSRAAIPALTRADSEETRQVGIAVSGLWFNGTPIPLDDPRLGTGWHRTETDETGKAWRWTDGAAELALTGAGDLTIEIMMTERYWQDTPPHARRPRARRA